MRDGASVGGPRRGQFVRVWLLAATTLSAAVSCGTAGGSVQDRSESGAESSVSSPWAGVQGSAVRPERFFADPAVRALAEAAARGDAAAVAAHHRAGADVNTVGADGMTPLIWTLGHQSKAGLRALLAAGANPNWRDQARGVSAMSLAAGARDPEFLAILLDHRGDPNLAGHRNEPIIFEAIMALQWPSMRLLAERGADINVRGMAGDTPLIRLVKLNQFEQAFYLVERGADWRARTGSGRTAVEFALGSRVSPTLPAHQWRERLLTLLRERGASIPQGASR